MVFQDSSRKLEKILVLIISRNLSSLEYHGVLKVETCPDRALTTPNRQVDQAKMPISGRTTPRFQLPDGCSFADHTSRGCCLSTCFHHPANDHMKLYDTGIGILTVYAAVNANTIPFCSSWCSQVQPAWMCSWRSTVPSIDSDSRWLGTNPLRRQKLFHFGVSLVAIVLPSSLQISPGFQSTNHLTTTYITTGCQLKMKDLSIYLSSQSSSVPGYVKTSKSNMAKAPCIVCKAFMCSGPT